MHLQKGVQSGSPLPYTRKPQQNYSHVPYIVTNKSPNDYNFEM